MKTLILVLLSSSAWSMDHSALRQGLLTASDDFDVQHLVTETENCVRDADSDASRMYACLAAWTDTRLPQAVRQRATAILPLIENARAQVSPIERMVFDALKAQLES